MRWSAKKVSRPEQGDPERGGVGKGQISGKKCLLLKRSERERLKRLRHIARGGIPFETEGCYAGNAPLLEREGSKGEKKNFNDGREKGCRKKRMVWLGLGSKKELLKDARRKKARRRSRGSDAYRPGNHSVAGGREDSHGKSDVGKRLALMKT